MAYAPIAYTTDTAVERILRTSNNKIKIGTDPGNLSPTDLAAYILDASMFIDSFLREVTLVENLPVATYSEKPEITYVAPRITAYLIHRDMYPTYRTEQMGKGEMSWKTETVEFLEMLKKHIDMGVYPDLSPASGGMQFVTAETFFQNKIGIYGLHDQIPNRENQEPTISGNIGPYMDGTL